jgi:hypothetical protein
MRAAPRKTLLRCLRCEQHQRIAEARGSQCEYIRNTSEPQSDAPRRGRRSLGQERAQPGDHEDDAGI